MSVHTEFLMQILDKSCINPVPIIAIILISTLYFLCDYAFSS